MMHQRSKLASGRRTLHQGVLRLGRWLLLAAMIAQLLPMPPALAQTTAVRAEEAAEPEEIRFEDYLLDTVDYYLPNGMRVILAEDSSAPVVAVDLWYAWVAPMTRRDAPALPTFLSI